MGSLPFTVIINISAQLTMLTSATLEIRHMVRGLYAEVRSKQITAGEVIQKCHNIEDLDVLEEQLVSQTSFDGFVSAHTVCVITIILVLHVFTCIALFMLVCRLYAGSALRASTSWQTSSMRYNIRVQP
jgi:hypothetical protein